LLRSFTLELAQSITQAKIFLDVCQTVDAEELDPSCSQQNIGVFKEKELIARYPRGDRSC
jgi:hypothetical protein